MKYWNEGQRAFAFFDEDEYFYPATILQIDGDDIYIRFDTGEEEWTSSDYLEEYLVVANDEVECQSNQDDLFYDVTVLEVDGERVEVEYDNGTTEWTSLNRLRFYIDEQ